MTGQPKQENPRSSEEQMGSVHADITRTAHLTLSDVGAASSTLKRHASELAQAFLLRAEDKIKEFERQIQDALSAARAAEEHAENILQQAEERARALEQEATEHAQAVKLQAETQAAQLLQERAKQTEDHIKATLAKVQQIVIQEMDTLMHNLSANFSLPTQTQQYVTEHPAQKIEASPAVTKQTQVVKQEHQLKAVSTATLQKTEPAQPAEHKETDTNELTLYEGKVFVIFPRDTPISCVRDINSALRKVWGVVVAGPLVTKESIHLELFVPYPEPLIKTLKGFSGVQQVEDITGRQDSTNALGTPTDAPNTGNSQFKVLRVTASKQPEQSSSDNPQSVAYSGLK